jgi:hypothetical protein
VSVAETLSEVEVSGAALLLDGDRIRIRYPEAQQHEELATQIAFLRAHRDEVAECLRARAIAPGMPPGVRLVGWNLKSPPVAIDTCSVVVDSDLFARRTIEQLRIALAQPKRWVGWTVPQLMDRLAQVGVVVALAPTTPENT